MQLESEAAHCVTFAQIAPHQSSAVDASFERGGHARHDDVRHGVLFEHGEQCLIKEPAIGAQAAQTPASGQLHEGFLEESTHAAS